MRWLKSFIDFVPLDPILTAAIKHLVRSRNRPPGFQPTHHHRSLDENHDGAGMVAAVWCNGYSRVLKGRNLRNFSRLKGLVKRRRSRNICIFHVTTQVEMLTRCVPVTVAKSLAKRINDEAPPANANESFTECNTAGAEECVGDANFTLQTHRGCTVC